MRSSNKEFELGESLWLVRKGGLTLANGPRRAHAKIAVVCDDFPVVIGRDMLVSLEVSLKRIWVASRVISSQGHFAFGIFYFLRWFYEKALFVFLFKTMVIISLFLKIIINGE